MAEPFQEDFFERIVNVNWETEPKTLWMAIGGNPFYVNGINQSLYLTQNVWSSPDGQHWTPFDQGLHSTNAPNIRAVGPVFVGYYMREDLLSGNPPVWVFGGADALFGQSGSAAFSSTDGVYIHTAQNFDFYATMGSGGILQNPGPPTAFAPRGTPGSVYLTEIPTLGRNYGTFKSSDGQKWVPPNYYGGVPPNPFAAMATEIHSEPGTIPVFITTPEAEVERTMAAMLSTLADPVPEHMTAPMPSPLSSVPGSADSTVFVNSTYYAFGKVKKGSLKNAKLIQAVIDPWTPYNGAHGGPTLSIIADGKSIGKTNCGITRTECVGYGYYNWCVGGQDIVNRQGYSVIAYSADLIHWKKVLRLPGNQINVLVVGPLKGAEDPHAPSGTNPTPG